MDNTKGLKDFQEVLNKMNLLNITEAYPFFGKNGVVLFLMPCEKAKTLYTQNQVKEIIKSLTKQQKLVV